MAGADGGQQVADGRWQVAGGRWQVADSRWQTLNHFPFVIFHFPFAIFHLPFNIFSMSHFLGVVFGVATRCRFGVDSFAGKISSKRKMTDERCQAMANGKWKMTNGKCFKVRLLPTASCRLLSTVFCQNRLDQSVQGPHCAALKSLHRLTHEDVRSVW